MATLNEQQFNKLKILLKKRHTLRRQVLDWCLANKRNINIQNKQAPMWGQYDAAELAICALLLEMELSL